MNLTLFYFIRIENRYFPSLALRWFLIIVVVVVVGVLWRLLWLCVVLSIGR